MAGRTTLDEAEAAACVRAIAACRDRDAFIRLFAAYAPRIKAQCMRAGLSSGDAEDVAQDAMLKVWLRAETYTPEAGRVSGWIAGIASHARIDALRRLRPTVPLDADRLDMATAPAASEGLDDDRLHRAVSSLPHAQRRVLELAYFADEPQTRIAQALQIPVGTVKSRIRLAVAALRKALGDR